MAAELVPAGTGNCRPDLCRQLSVYWDRVQWFKSEMRCQSMSCVWVRLPENTRDCRADCRARDCSQSSLLEIWFQIEVIGMWLNTGWSRIDSIYNVCTTDYRARDCRAHSLTSDFRCRSLKSDSIHNDLRLTPHTMTAELTIELVTAERIHWHLIPDVDP